jgi:hypothetical protein
MNFDGGANDPARKFINLLAGFGSCAGWKISWRLHKETWRLWRLGG